MKKSVLKNYARLIARMGVNIKKGQGVLIEAEVEQPEFVKILAEECYRAGASYVRVEWRYMPLTKLDVRYRSLRSLQTVRPWEEEKLRERMEELPCRIALTSEDPDALAGVDTAKLAKWQQARYSVFKQYYDKMEGRFQWCIAAVPGAAWAKKVFPGLRTSQAIEKLWELIIFCSRAESDPIAAWEEHNRDLASRCAYLNGLGLTELRYRASNGTDLRVGLIPEGAFRGGKDVDLLGHEFNANIPSDEIYTSPMRGKAEGIVYASMPLCYQGQLIENFSVRFEGGKAVEVHAEKNEELLKEMIAMDEGASFLGECALVPYDTPIRKTGVLFYNTLFDENASCHLALGAGYIDTLQDYGKYTLEECHKLGINESMNHEDFMIGTADLDIDGVDGEGKLIPIFRAGNWAF